MQKYIIHFLVCLAILVVLMSLLGCGKNSGKKTVETSIEDGEKGVIELKKEKERDPERDSVETYKDLTKLLISLATGTMVLTPTLLTLWKTGRIKALWSLCISSGFLVGSVICGICVLSTLAGSQHANEYNIDYPLTRLFSIPQWISFIVGLIFFMIFAFKNLRNRDGESAQFEAVLDALVEKNLMSNEEKGVLLNKIKKI